MCFLWLELRMLRFTLIYMCVAICVNIVLRAIVLLRLLYINCGICDRPSVLPLGGG